MRARWVAFHETLLRSISMFGTRATYAEARCRRPLLQPHEDVPALLAFLNARAGDLDEKDRLYAMLVEWHRSGEPGADLAATLLWLGLWPGLDGVYRRAQWAGPWTPDELVSEIAYRFTELVRRVDLARTPRLASTLVRSTERDLADERCRLWDEQARRSEEAPEDVIAATQEVGLPVTLLGNPAGLSAEAQLAAIRGWLVGLLGEDADLVLGFVVLGESLREAGARLGLSREAAKKRYQRALERLRGVLEEKSEKGCPRSPFSTAFLKWSPSQEGEAPADPVGFESDPDEESTP